MGAIKRALQKESGCLFDRLSDLIDQFSEPASESVESGSRSIGIAVIVLRADDSGWMMAC
jgi:hypothetical protein